MVDLKAVLSGPGPFPHLPEAKQGAEMWNRCEYHHPVSCVSGYNRLASLCPSDQKDPVLRKYPSFLNSNLTNSQIV